MPAEELELSILKNNDILSVEDYLSRLKDDVKKVTLKLPRNHRTTFFKDAWISSFIATASYGRDLVITDWNDHSGDEELYERFSSSLIGITSAFVAKEINDISHRQFKFDLKDIVDRVVFDCDGLIEDHEAGKSFVFCCFDSTQESLNYPTPYSLDANSKEQFIRKFLDIKRDRIDHTNEKGSAHQLAFTHESDLELASLICELYDNTLHHGRYDEHNQIISGVRSVTIRRHVSHDTKKQLLERAKPFKELENYISMINQKKNLHFYEISISDNGIGIIKRFANTRPELYRSHNMDDVSDAEKINRIIRRNLSSKLYPGSGLGLTLAFENLKNRKGFVSLRTDEQWLYFDGTMGNLHKENLLQPVKHKGALSRVTGTHYNILIPVS